MVTVTGAWFSFPAAFGWVSETSTVMVAPEPLTELFDELPDWFAELLDDEFGVVATRPTWVTTPGVVLPSGT
jgi:hypothetical protein